MSPITIRKNTLSGQSRGALLCLHIGFTMICLNGWWKEWQGLRIALGAPVHDPKTGYHCTRWGIGRMRFIAPQSLSLGNYA